MNSLISVIVPIYNVEDYLDRCVESIINQTYKNLEIILVDDGSPDNCPQMCDDYAKKDSRIKVVHKENGGLSDARNAGMEVATGEYISFVDSDDWIDLETFSLSMAKIKECNAQIVAFNIINVSDKPFIPNLSNKYEVVDSQTAIENTIDDINIKTVVWNKIYKRSVLQGLKFRKDKINEDEFFTFYALSKAKKIVYLYRQCYYYYQRSNSIMGTYSLKRLDMLDGVKERMEFVKVNYPELYVKAKLSLCSCCVYHYQMLLKNKNADNDNYGKKKVKEIRNSVKVLPSEIKDKRLLDRFIFKISNFSFGLELVCRIRNWLKVGM